MRVSFADIRQHLSPAVLILCLALFPAESTASSVSLDDLVEQENRQRALDDLKLAPFSDPDLFTLLRDANNALRAGDFATAEQHARDLTERSPESPQGWHLLGLALANLGRTDEAIAALDAANLRYERSADPLVVKGDLLLSQGRTDAARRTFLEAAEKDPVDWRAHESLALIALANGDRAEAVTRLERVVDLDPQGNFAPHVRLATLYLGDGRVEDATAVLGAFSDARPEHPESRVALGRIAFSEGRNADAERLFDAAISLSPEAPRLRVFKARAQLNAARLDEAEATLLAAEEAFPGNREIALELAGFYGARRDYAAAAARFEAGLEAWPGDPAFRIGLSRAAYRLGDFETALAQAAALAERDGAGPGDHFWHAVVLERLDRREAAIEAYETAIAGNPGNWIALNNLASLITDRDPARAIDLASQALDLSEGVTQVRSTLGWALAAIGEREQAVAIFREVSDADPENPVYAYRLGRLLIDTGADEEGRQLVSRALALDPGFRDAADAKALLAQE